MITVYMRVSGDRSNALYMALTHHNGRARTFPGNTKDEAHAAAEAAIGKEAQP